jgi:hypothetical protein
MPDEVLLALKRSLNRSIRTSKICMWRPCHYGTTINSPALPTFQQPLLLECYKSIQTDFVAFGVCTRQLAKPDLSTLSPAARKNPQR